jgi:hypothetical protein
MFHSWSPGGRNWDLIDPNSRATKVDCSQLDAPNQAVHEYGWSCWHDA